MRTLRQTLLLTLSALLSIPERLGSSLVTFIGIATVMGVLVSMLSLGQGIEYLAQTGVRADRATVTASGSENAMDSSLPRTAIGTILDKPGIKRDASGKPLASGVVLMLISGITKQNQRGNIGFFAAGSNWHEIWPEVQIIQGRLFRPGLHEIIVSDRMRQRFKNLEVGDEIRAQGTYWKVVGVYRSSSSFFDNALIGDLDTVLAAFPQQALSSVNVVLESPAAFNTLKRAISSEPTLSATLKTEAEANETVIKSIRGILDFIAYFIGGLMGLGAACGALSSLYAAVDARTAEIATLRAIGFRGTPIVVSVLAEGMLLALPAALLGAAVAWFLFNGDVVIAGGVSFPMTVTAHLVAVSILWSLAIALIGGLMPSLRASRMP
ncbi:MAG TPA: ABC transporter permease, partial [Steroidobacteraceae bacterium]|nr:ABC transporter permease [Steroidobacteraceae bacterium]